MSRINTYVDGSWLFRICAPNKVLARKTETPDIFFPFNFKKFDQTLLNYINHIDPGCAELGDRFISTSIFTWPSVKEIEQWLLFSDGKYSKDNISNLKKGIDARQKFTHHAINAGYSDQAIYRPILKKYMFERWVEHTYQEKQVDTTVVALLIKYAITRHEDYHVIVTGDSDVLPAIKIAYPEYTRNVIVATSHPDELKAENRQTSFSLSEFQFDIAPFYFQDHIKELIHGRYTYNCGECNKVFSRDKQIDTSRQRPYCKECAKLKK
ncbi:MAG: hypothetical protein AB1439_03410 [candidate division FCPU426 bacterium]